MASRHRVRKRGLSGANFAIAAISAAVVFAAVVSAAVVYFIGSTVSYAGDAADSVAPPPQTVGLEGTIVAVSADSVTARGADGRDRTYLVNADTTAITGTSGQVDRGGSAFAVNDEVSIVGVMVDGTPVATAVAHRSVSNLNGPPMDYALP
jgi:hypothetical protein